VQEQPGQEDLVSWQNYHWHILRRQSTKLSGAARRESLPLLEVSRAAGRGGNGALAGRRIPRFLAPRHADLGPLVG
jgi:hypothetical protein